MKKLILSTLTLSLLGLPAFAADKPAAQPMDKPMMGCCAQMKEMSCCCCKGMVQDKQPEAQSKPTTGK